MPNQNVILQTEAAHIMASLTNLQPLFPGKSSTEILARVLITSHFDQFKVHSEQGSKHLTEILDTLEQVHHGKSKGNRVAKTTGNSTPESVAAFAKTQKTFSSKEAQKHFKVGAQKMAGSLAVLTKRCVLRQLAEAAEDGTSAWRYVGKGIH